MAQTQERNHCYLRKKWNLSPECGRSCDQFQSCYSFMYKKPFNNPDRTIASWDLIRPLRERSMGIWQQPLSRIDTLRKFPGAANRQKNDVPGAHAGCVLE